MPAVVPSGTPPAGPPAAAPIGRRAALARVLSGSVALLGAERAAWSAAVRAAAPRPALLASTGAHALDVQMLETQASIEALAVEAYQQALALPALKTMPDTSVVRDFATTTLSHHRSHLTLFNQTVEDLGGRPQTTPDPRYASSLKSQLTQLAKESAQAAVTAAVDLATTLESVAAETYAKNSATFVAGRARVATASVTGIEAQHVAALRALQSLLKTTPAFALTFGADAAYGLAASAGDIGFPDAFFPTSLASPPDEGAVR